MSETLCFVLGLAVGGAVGAWLAGFCYIVYGIGDEPWLPQPPKEKS